MWFSKLRQELVTSHIEDLRTSAACGVVYAQAVNRAGLSIRNSWVPSYGACRMREEASVLPPAMLHCWRALGSSRQACHDPVRPRPVLTLN